MVGLCCLTVYLSLAAPGFFWLDSSELSAAAWELGIAHPPGHPLPGLLGKLLALLPVGTIYFRVTLASALAAAAAAALTVQLSLQVLGRLGAAAARPAWAAPAAATVAGLVVGLSYAVAFQAVRAEVYALNLCLLLAGACLLLRWDETGDRRPLLLSGLVCGLALCNHHFLVVLALPAVLLFVLLRRREQGWHRNVVGLVLAGLLGLSVLAYLPLRSARDPQVNWGSPHTAERFAWVVSAKAFQKALNKAQKETVEHRAMGAVFAVAGGLGPVAAVVALGGLYFLWRRRQTRRPALLLSGMAAFNLLSPLTVGFDPLNPDAHGYLSVAVAFLAPGIAVLVTLMACAAARLGRAAPALVMLLACTLPAMQAASSLPRSDLRRFWQAEETTRAMMDLPPRAIIFSAYFESLFNLWALRVVADHRPDLDLMHRHFLPMPGYLPWLERNLPELGAMAPRWLERKHLLAADMDRLAAARPLSVEYDQRLLPEVAARLEPDGLLTRYLPPGGSLKDAAARHRHKIAAWHRALGPVTELESVRAVTYHHYLLTHHACHRGRRALAGYHHGLALQLAPQSRDLAQLASQCGLGAGR